MAYTILKITDQIIKSVDKFTFYDLVVFMLFQSSLFLRYRVLQYLKLLSERSEVDWTI